jgi:hypothetical protein
MNVRMLLAVPALVGLSASVSLAQFDPSKADWGKADREIRRLPPNAFPQLPANLVQDLQRRGCTIPQEHFKKEPHNVIWGEFAKPGQTDWAVLCSINRVSSILVYWNASEKNPAEVNKGEDQGRLQHLGGDVIGYSRVIEPVGAKGISVHNTEFPGPKRPPIDHPGIEDSFVGKASVILYYSAGIWLRLQGAD